MATNVSEQAYQPAQSKNAKFVQRSVGATHLEYSVKFFKLFNAMFIQLFYIK